jgi:ribokinase
MARIRIAVVNGAGVGLVYRVGHPPRPGETVIAESCVVMPGGKGSNQAIGIARLGADAVLLSALGDDALADIPRRVWEREGVDYSGVTVRHGATLTGSVIVDAAGENVVVLDLGVLTHLSASDIEGQAGLIASADLCLVGLEIPTEPALAALRIARRYGVPSVLNLAPAPEPAAADDLLAQADVVIPNEVEGEMLTGDSEPEAIAVALLSRGPRAVVVTLGPRGALVANGSGVTMVSPHPVSEIVDTTGAGDAFNAAFSVALAKGHSVERAARWGNEGGARICRGFGFVDALGQWDGFAIPEARPARDARARTSERVPTIHGQVQE